MRCQPTQTEPPEIRKTTATTNTLRFRNVEARKIPALRAPHWKTAPRRITARRILCEAGPLRTSALAADQVRKVCAALPRSLRRAACR